jgi:hypothetical protein
MPLRGADHNLDHTFRAGAPPLPVPPPSCRRRPPPSGFAGASPRPPQDDCHGRRSFAFACPKEKLAPARSRPRLASSKSSFPSRAGSGNGTNATCLRLYDSTGTRNAADPARRPRPAIEQRALPPCRLGLCVVWEAWVASCACRGRVTPPLTTSSVAFGESSKEVVRPGAEFDATYTKCSEVT